MFPDHHYTFERAQLSGMMRASCVSVQEDGRVSLLVELPFGVCLVVSMPLASVEITDAKAAHKFLTGLLLNDAALLVRALKDEERPGEYLADLMVTNLRGETFSAQGELVRAGYGRWV